MSTTRRQPHERPTNTVFQSYALFPGYACRGKRRLRPGNDGVPGAERERRVKETLDLVGLGGMEHRRISERPAVSNSGGARPALVKRQPCCCSMNRWVHLTLVRRQMQDEPVRIKQSTGNHFDPRDARSEEACAIADRIAVMKRWYIVQIDTPEVSTARRAIPMWPASSTPARSSAGVTAATEAHEGHIAMFNPRNLLSYLTDVSAIAAMLPRNQIKAVLEQRCSGRVFAAPSSAWSSPA